MTLKPQRDAETSPPSVSEGLGMTDNPIVILPLQGIFLCHPDLVGIPLGCWTKFGYNKKQYNKFNNYCDKLYFLKRRPRSKMTKRQEIISRAFKSAPKGIRTPDLLAENQSSLAARRWELKKINKKTLFMIIKFVYL